MKQLLRRSLRTVFVVAVLLAVSSSQATAAMEGTWQAVGAPDFALNAALDLNFILDHHGTPYVAYSYVTGGRGGPWVGSVLRFDGTTWQSVGTPEIPNVCHPMLALDSHDTPYLAYSDESGSPTTVLRFDGTTWQVVAAEGPSNLGAFLLDSQDHPYVLYQQSWYDQSIGGWRSGVFVSHFDGAAWQDLAMPHYDGAVFSFSLALDSHDTPYLAYATLGGPSGDWIGTVERYDGATWQLVGPYGFIGGVNELTLALDRADTPYVAYGDCVPGSSKATVTSFDGTAWHPVGTPRFSSTEAYGMRLAIDSAHIPYVAFADQFSDGEVTVMGFDGSAWQAVGGQGALGTQTALSLAVDFLDNLYAASADSVSGAANVRRFLGTASAAVEPAAPATLILPQNGGNVDFPAGAVAAPITITFSQQAGPTQNTGSFAFANRAFTLEARDAGGNPVTSFLAPYQITLRYGDADWQAAGITDESTLNLNYWDGSAWVPVLPCAACSLDTANNVLIARLDHFTHFALLGKRASPLDCSAAQPSVALLWPANHKLVSVSILGVTDPEGGAVSITITNIWQDEPVLSPGSGDFAPDGRGVGGGIAQVRAEREGAGNGRVYHVAFAATDTRGGTCSGEALVRVPHNQGGNAADDGKLFDSTAMP